MKYLPSFLAAICFAVAPNFIRMALSQGFSPMAGSLIAMAMALPVYGGVVLGQRQRVFANSVDLRYGLFAVGAGILTGSASLLLYLALSSLQVSVVVAINSGALVFNLFLAYFLLREQITWKVLLGTGFIGLGIFLVVFQ